MRASSEARALLSHRQERTQLAASRRQVSWSTAERLWVLALVAAVVVPGAWHVSRASFSNDEAATWAISGHGIGDLWHVLSTSGGDRGAALYYGVASAWMRVFGTSEFALRLLSVLAASVTMVPFHASARRLAAPPAAWAAGAVLATSSFFLIYARDARTYAFATLFVVLSVWTFVRAVESKSAHDWWTFTVLATVAVYAHWFSALVIFALFVALASMRPVGELRRHALTGAGALVVLTLPIGALVLTSANSGVDWIAPLNLAELRATAQGFAGTGDAVLQLIVAAILIVGLASAWNGRRASRTPPIALTWFVIPVALTILLSTVKPLLVTRYLIVALPGFALLIGLGLSRIARGRIVPLAAMTVALIFFSYSTVWNTSARAENWRSIVAQIGQRSTPSDAIVVFPPTAVSAFSYYARHDSTLRHRLGPTWPHERWATPFTRSIANTDVLRSSTLARSRVVWLVVRSPHGSTVTKTVRNSPELAALRKRLAQRFASATVLPSWRTSDTVFVVRYSQPTAH